MMEPRRTVIQASQRRAYCGYDLLHHGDSFGPPDPNPIALGGGTFSIFL